MYDHKEKSFWDEYKWYDGSGNIVSGSGEDGSIALLRFWTESKEILYKCSEK